MGASVVVVSAVSPYLQYVIAGASESTKTLHTQVGVSQ